MQKSRKDSHAPRRAGSAQPGHPGAVWRARRLPSVPPPAPLLKVLLLRTTARQPLRRPPSPAAPGSTMARDVEALDLPAWSRASGLSQGPQCRSVPWGRSPWGAPPSCGRSSGGSTATPPRAALLLASPGARTSAPGARRPACAEKVLQDTKLRRSPDALQPGAWRPGGGGDSRWGGTPGHAPLFPKAYADQPGDPAAGAARATPRLRVPALRPGSASTGQLVEE